MYKNVKSSLTMSPNNLPISSLDYTGFVMAIEVHSFDIAGNKAIPFTLELSPAKSVANNMLE